MTGERSAGRAAWVGMERRGRGARGDRRACSGADRKVTAELVEEVLRTALALEDVISSLLAELPPRAFPGEDPAHVLLDMVVGSVHPAAAAAGLRDCRAAIALVVAIRERVLADLHTAAELSKPPASNPEK
jgi:hypothetical protein